MSDSLKQSLPSCVLFDFDGTMYRFEDVYTHVWRDLYEDERQVLGEMEFQAFYDRIGEIFTSMPPGLGGDEEHDYVFGEIKQVWPGIRSSNARLIEDYRSRSLKHMRPRAGLDDLLSRLDDHGIPWGIISNHDSRNRHKLAAMDLRSQPATFMLSVEVGVWKPETRIFDMALEEIGSVDRSSAVMVGDNPEADIIGGKGAGMRTVLMLDSPFAAGHDGSADLAITGFQELHDHWFSE